jgi:UDP-glucose 4-epimerase
VETPGVHGILNIGTGRATSVNEILKALAHALGRPVPSQHAAARPGEQRRSVLDARLAETQLGWRASTWLADGLRLTVEHARLELDDVV